MTDSGVTAQLPLSKRPRPTPSAARWLAAAVLSATFGLSGIAGAPAAFAHGGEIEIDLGSDGAGGISATLVYAGDEHPVEESADLTVTAVSDDGQKVGPVRLASASEGVGWYTSEPGLLGEGHWTLTATMNEPAEQSATTEIDVAPAPEPSPVEVGDPPSDDAAAAPQDDDAASASAQDESAPPLGWIALAVALVLAAGTTVLVVVRRRAAPHP